MVRRIRRSQHHFYGFVFFVAATLLAGSAWLVAQEAQPNQPAAGQQAAPDRNQRLEAIEKALQTLLKEVQSLRPGASSPAATTESAAAATTSLTVDPQFLKSLNWRSIGPANMGGRITDIAVYEADPSLWWVATASGGLLKTINNGVTLEHQFDHEGVVSIGAVAVAQSDANIVWVGTGEANPRNSVSYGDGVYKSTDGGKTWKNMGLKKTYQIARVLIHPKDPNVVWVGALGRLYGPNEDRGVFKTTDGGQTWNKVLYVDDKTGVIDMIMDPTNPDTVIAALWDRLRDGFDSWPGNEVPKPDGIDGYDPIRKWGPGGGLYKTADGGKKWTKLKTGLPSSHTGRIGIDWQRKAPYHIYAIIDCADIGKGLQPLNAYLGAVGADADGKAKLTQIMPGSPAEKAGLAVGDVVLAIGDKDVTGFDQVLDELRPKRRGEMVTLKINRGGETKSIEATLANRPGQGGQGGAGGGGGGGSRVWLGVTGEDRAGKATLTQIIPDGPGAKAGLKDGDVIVTADGKPVEDYSQLSELVRDKEAGTKVALKVARGSENLDVTVTLEERPPGGFGGRGGGGGTFGGPPSDVFLGIQGEDGPQGGARLTQITEDGPAEKAGLEQGDIIQAIDAQKLANYDALTEAIRTKRAGDKMKLTILRANETKEIEVTLENRPGGPTRTRPYTYSYFGQSPNVQDQQGAKGYEYGGVYRSKDGGETWERINSLNTRPMYFSVIKVDPSDEKHLYVLGVSQHQSHDGGLTFTGDFGRGVHADGHQLWIDPKDGRHMITGGDGGFYATYDRGRNWDHINTAAIGQFYHVAIGPKEPYWVFGGLQDNGSWGGPAISKNGGVLNEDWLSVGGGDGFVCRVDPNDPDLVYSESQNGSIGRRHLRTGERASIRPVQRPRGTPPYRFNWNTPFILSSHNSRIFYSAGNHVFRSLDRGNDLRPISPEITLTKRGSATALAESPRNPNVLYVGTDDGALWVTRDGGHEWKNITKNLGIPSPRWVATIEPSRFEEGRVYVCLDAHRSDDDDPYIFVSEDYGETFRSVRANLPWGSTRCLREDVQNQNLLFCGTEFNLWASFDRGANWTKLNNNLPTVAIHEIAIHPTNGELVVATHGRSIWACDISALRQLSAEHFKDKIALHKPVDVIRWQSEPNRGRTNRRFTGTNPAGGAQLWYSLPAKAERVTLRIEDIEGRVVRELRGSTDAGLQRVSWDLVRVNAQRGGGGGGGAGSGQRGGFTRGRGAGTQARSASEGSAGGTSGQAAATTESRTASDQATPSATVTTQAQPPATGTQPPGAGGQRGGAAQRGGGPGGGGGGGGGGGSIVPNGAYRVVLVVDGREQPPQTVRLARDPNAPENVVAEEESETAILEEQAADREKAISRLHSRDLRIDD
jgi:S1-C subfamily serine protease/photosystem II stability/assembly factor-like uncharacterized protein